ncbi:MAG: putative lipid II flippase FtsW [bacterium]|nr:putative lipid II flippase FtsW [bacterium]MDT8395283.1 putative lipid II flippase FtsW [bacterium]
MRHLRLDPTIVIAVLALAVLGTVIVFSASAVRADNEHGGDGYYYFKRQLFFLGAGLVALLVGAAIPYHFWEAGVIPLLGATILLLGLVLTPLGHTANSASRWFRVGPVSLQIAEFAKMVVVIYLARYLSSRGDRIREDPKTLLPPLAVMAVIFFLVVREPDLGTAIFIGLLGCAMLFLSGATMRVMTGLGLAAAPVVAYLIYTQNFRVQRMKAFLDPFKEYDGSGFQLVQSYVAFGDGGLFGKGLGAGKSKLFFLPESHTDFILAVIGEELGFIGVAAVLCLFAVFIVKGMGAASSAPDGFGSMLGAGLTLMIGIQALINGMVVLGLLPTKGLPLPFISYGGSSLLTSMMAAGIILNVAGRSREL